MRNSFSKSICPKITQLSTNHRTTLQYLHAAKLSIVIVKKLQFLDFVFEFCFIVQLKMNGQLLNTARHYRFCSSITLSSKEFHLVKKRMSKILILRIPNNNVLTNNRMTGKKQRNKLAKILKIRI